MPEDFAHSKALQLVQLENTRNRLVELLFEGSVEDHMLELAEREPRVFLIYLHLVYLRSCRRQVRLGAFYGTAEKILKQDKVTAEWYLEQVNEHFFYEFLFYSEY